MGILARLRRLDDRVLGRPKPPTPETHRNTFVLGLLGASVVLIALAATGRWTAIGAVGGFLGMALGGGLRWYRSTRRSS